MNGSAAKPLVEAVHPLLGARITRLDLRGLLDPRLKQTLRENLAEYGVLYFPQQSIDPDDQSAFASLFGRVDVAGTSVANPSERQSTPGVKYISNIREEGKPIGALPDGEMHFHSDGSHRKTPYRATTLYALKVPLSGGETRFASMTAAFEALPVDLRSELEGLSARHVFNYNKTLREDMRLEDAAAHAIHPMVKTHPDTGRKALYLSRLMTRDIVGRENEEGCELLAFLMDHCEQEEFIYEHSWRPGDLVIWDNRSVNHARNDFPPDQRRLLRRYTVSDVD